MYSGEYDACDVTLSVYPPTISTQGKLEKYAFPPWARHIFQAFPVWIYTQSNITSIHVNSLNMWAGCFQFDSNKHFKFSVGTPVSSCIGSRVDRYWTSKKNSSELIKLSSIKLVSPQLLMPHTKSSKTNFPYLSGLSIRIANSASKMSCKNWNRNALYKKRHPVVSTSCKYQSQAGLVDIISQDIISQLYRVSDGRLHCVLYCNKSLCFND